MLLSGYSAALMKFILSGEMEEERITIDAEGKVVKTRSLLDPRLTLHRVLHDSGKTLSLARSLSLSLTHVTLFTVSSTTQARLSLFRSLSLALSLCDKLTKAVI
jgi:hypothetical protein